ncbi:hypothetical protein [Natrialba aegyptia]|uniref:hypothetical protein n=1 Tax=Natrialba aegyptia TaxID=129789 RepID=UPI0012678CDD|nr:hypothetical protein [Natrialba aegyptia]
MVPEARKFIYGGTLTVAVLATALLSDYFAILLALGPTVYLLSLGSRPDEISAKDVLISHLTAIIAGWIAYLLLVQGIEPMTVAPQSIESFRVIASMTLATGLTAIVLVRFTAQIITAYVTATIVALGILPSLPAIGALVVGVALLTGLHAIFQDVGEWSSGVPP